MNCWSNLKSKKRWLALALTPVLVVGLAAASLPALSTPAPDPETSAAIAEAKSMSLAFREAAKGVQPSVVLIHADPVLPVEWNGNGRAPGDRPLEKRFGQSPFGSPFGGMPELRRFFEGMPKTPHRGGPGVGSGVIIDTSGVILTNNHVVEGRNEITVRLHDGREFKAVEVKSDPNTDMAIVRIEGADDHATLLLVRSEHGSRFIVLHPES